MFQCRHCEEIFTSKISFRIHQRKHTEEARLRGTLDGEDNLQCGGGKAKILSKRAAERKKQKMMRSECKMWGEVLMLLVIMLLFVINFFRLLSSYGKVVSHHKSE